MNGGLIHNKKFNLLAFLSMGLFLLIGVYRYLFMDIYYASCCCVFLCL